MLQVAGTKDHYVMCAVGVLVQQASPVNGVPGCRNVSVHMYMFLRVCVYESVLVFVCVLLSLTRFAHHDKSRPPHQTGTDVRSTPLPLPVWLSFTDPYSPSPTPSSHTPLSSSIGLGSGY